MIFKHEKRENKGTNSSASKNTNMYDQIRKKFKLCRKAQIKATPIPSHSSWKWVCQARRNKPRVYMVYFLFGISLISLLFSHWVMPNSLKPHVVQHTRPPCPSPSPRACSNSRPLSWWCQPLLLPSVFPSLRVFSNEWALRIRWPEYWSFSFSISSSYEYSGLISFGIDWLDLLAVQGTLNSLL